MFVPNRGHERRRYRGRGDRRAGGVRGDGGGGGDAQEQGLGRAQPRAQPRPRLLLHAHDLLRQHVLQLGIGSRQVKLILFLYIYLHS